ncbi:hypothetical protein GPECTOR_3g418 [Gonium pectorale]|uniref:Uncharacterized protein n=1 Tax=Gonium pectorale TaxID=33097 RepID=A0A150GZK9_GONPE|nr:hypothetical protein GPECTOR_3g418 [Gonium pectorale]|eukprot:KXZ55281.1 hypothetical protein GPECTOR_3g418 [Gonium pectorale]
MATERKQLMQTVRHQQAGSSGGGAAAVHSGGGAAASGLPPPPPLAASNSRRAITFAAGTVAAGTSPAAAQGLAEAATVPRGSGAAAVGACRTAPGVLAALYGPGSATHGSASAATAPALEPLRVSYGQHGASPQRLPAGVALTESEPSATPKAVGAAGGQRRGGRSGGGAGAAGTAAAGAVGGAASGAAGAPRNILRRSTDTDLQAPPQALAGQGPPQPSQPPHPQPQAAVHAPAQPLQAAHSTPPDCLLPPLPSAFGAAHGGGGPPGMPLQAPDMDELLDVLQALDEAVLRRSRALQSLAQPRRHAAWEGAAAAELGAAGALSAGTGLSPQLGGRKTGTGNAAAGMPPRWPKQGLGTGASGATGGATGDGGGGRGFTRTVSWSGPVGARAAVAAAQQPASAPVP